MHIQIGGAFNQYDTNLADYLKVTKSLYKDLVTVVKDPESEEIVCRSQVFKITKVDGATLYTS
jgi:hypothetical protein